MMTDQARVDRLAKRLCEASAWPDGMKRWRRLIPQAKRILYPKTVMLSPEPVAAGDVAGWLEETSRKIHEATSPGVPFEKRSWRLVHKGVTRADDRPVHAKKLGGKDGTD
jgi:hypothetical protein